MIKEKIERKIAVIFATDVVGYSKHMETDESETIHNLRQCEAILTGFFERHDGRLFNTGGDSFLAEFSSAVSAVECAVDFQHAIKLRNASDEATVKLEFRIGINSGDVVKEKDNLLGDGVNIAARLEALAQTNGITISKVIYDYVKGKTKYEFNDLGLQKIKQNEFYAYDLLLDQSQKRKLVKKKFSKVTQHIEHNKRDISCKVYKHNLLHKIKKKLRKMYARKIISDMGWTPAKNDLILGKAKLF